MTTSWRPVSAATRARLKGMMEEPLSLEEWRAWSERVPSAEELEETRELIRWFCRRYPTAAERLAYARRAYARWTRPWPQDAPDNKSE